MKNIKTNVKMVGRTTITITKDMHDKLRTIKIKTRAKDLNAVLERLIK